MISIRSITEENDSGKVLVVGAINGRRVECMLDCEIGDFSLALIVHRMGRSMRQSFDFLSPAEIEFLITGVTPDEQSEIEQQINEAKFVNVDFTIKPPEN